MIRQQLLVDALPLPVVSFNYLAAPQRERDAFDCGWYWSRKN